MNSSGIGFFFYCVLNDFYTNFLVIECKKRKLMRNIEHFYVKQKPFNYCFIKSIVDKAWVLLLLVHIIKSLKFNFHNQVANIHTWNI